MQPGMKVLREQFRNVESVDEMGAGVVKWHANSMNCQAVG